VAENHADGKVYRSSLRFTFGAIKCGSGTFELGATVHGKTTPSKSSVEKLSRSFFIHHETDTSPGTQAQLRDVDLSSRDTASKTLQRAGSKAELVLCEEQRLFVGAQLQWIKGTIKVADSLHGQAPDTLLCRYALQSNKLCHLRYPPLLSHAVCLLSVVGIYV